MFGFRLCQKLSGIGPAARHPKYLMEVMSSSEWEDWKAFYHLNPFGDDILVMMIAKFWKFYIDSTTSDESGQPPIELEDLMPGKDAETRWDEIEEMVEDRMEEIRQEKAEARRLSKMTQDEIDREEQEKWIRAHAARFGRTAEEPSSE